MSNITGWCQEVTEHQAEHEYIYKQNRQIGVYLVNTIMCISAVPPSCCVKRNKYNTFLGLNIHSWFPF